MQKSFTVILEEGADEMRVQDAIAHIRGVDSLRTSDFHAALDKVQSAVRKALHKLSEDHAAAEREKGGQ